MKTWKIPVCWTMMGTVNVEAKTLDEAIEIAKDDAGIIPIPDDGTFMDGTWEVDCTDIDYLRKWYNGKLYNAISDYAKILEKDKIVAFCDIAVGDYTDPDGHELLVIIPYERRTEIKKIAEALENVVYNGVESLI